jgi:hypothetical protein
LAQKIAKPAAQRSSSPQFGEPAPVDRGPFHHAAAPLSTSLEK